MKHTEEEITRAAQRFEQLADELDPSRTSAEDIEDLRTVAEAADAVRVSEARLAEAVQRARARGRSWNRISIALGVTRQAARQRFGGKPKDPVATARARKSRNANSQPAARSAVTGRFIKRREKQDA